jgi:hypothetical protein
LKENFPYVYFPKTQPDHPEFPLEWGTKMEDRSKLIRAVFIGSQRDLGHNTNLTVALPLNYDSAKGTL